MANENQTATAPYNFVSLPQGVLLSPIDGGAESDEQRRENYRRHVLAPGRLSGRIDLEIRTLTSLFIGAEGADFFSPAGVPIIPGSTLRGMVKNLFKIVTCGAMRGEKEDYDDRRLYFRTLADPAKTGMQKLYSDEMSVQDRTRKGKPVSKTRAEAGYLVHLISDGKYYICPAAFEVIVDKKRAQEKFHCVEWNQPQSGWAECYTGPMKGKGSYTEHRAVDWSRRIPVPNEVVQSYIADKNLGGVRLLPVEDDKKKLPCVARLKREAHDFTGDSDIDLVAPCFYKAEQGEVKHFGFGRFYRIPYQSSIGAHVIGMETDGVDYADALFGRKELWGSRLAFTDALPIGQPVMETAAYSKVLGEPKPTALQLYLEQKGEKYSHWDCKGVPIRGYKLYWHQKKETNWRSDDQRPKNMTTTPIRPVKDNTVFVGSIRFERLSEDELGALLSVFRIRKDGKDLCCKLGKGKSLGLGSVRITPKLSLIDAADSYRNAFDWAGDWNAAEREADTDCYIKAFACELDRLDDAVRERYRKAQEELKHILRWEHTQTPRWEEKIAQMSIGKGDGRFRSRAILPSAKDVK